MKLFFDMNSLDINLMMAGPEQGMESFTMCVKENSCIGRHSCYPVMSLEIQQLKLTLV